MVPKVSVIVPVFNSEKYLLRCLESIRKQTYSNIEIIIINDGSTDTTEKIVLNLKDEENRIVYEYQENSGPSEARNKGISLSKGDYLIFIDSDDSIEPTYIELLLNEIINSNADLVCCGYKDISEYGEVDVIDFPASNNVSVHAFMEMACKGTGGVLWSKIFKKEIISKHNLKMDKNIFMSEDLVFVLHYVSHCNSFRSIKKYLYHYNRLNQGSISSNISKDYLHNYINVCLILEKIFKEVRFDHNKASEIISRKIQGIVISIIEQQSTHIKFIYNGATIKSVKQILSLNYISNYKVSFYTNKWVYKPFVFFIKKNLIRMSITYGVYINVLKNIKNKVKKGKKVSL